jgi:hypothetical protein
MKLAWNKIFFVIMVMNLGLYTILRIYYVYQLLPSEEGNIVGIATSYGLDDRGSEFENR